MLYQTIKFFLPLVFCYFGNQTTLAQYAPQATLPGSTAIHKNSPSIKAWATHCTIQRGWQNIADKNLGYTTSGDSSWVTGMADGLVVSLGDSGSAVVTFAQPITNGPGFDFAIFENGFPNPLNSKDAYLELATVAVSSDGVQFYTFPAHSLTPTQTQIAGAGVYMEAELLNNLAGKYIGQYGTPFDLQELSEVAGLDIDHITHIKITDVVGSIDQWGTKDTAGNYINDPYPTPFNVGGFDLDAVAVLHSAANTLPSLTHHHTFQLYPNPVVNQLFIGGLQQPAEIIISSILGKQISRSTLMPNQSIAVEALKSGVYLITILDENREVWQGRFCK